MGEQIYDFVDGWLKEQGCYVTGDTANWLHRGVLFVIVLLIAWLAGLLCRRVLFPLITHVVERTQVTWDDYLFNPKVLRCMGRLVPPLVVYVFLPFVFDDKSETVWLYFLKQATQVYLIVLSVKLVFAFISSLQDYSLAQTGLRNRSFKGLYQMLKIVVLCVAIIGIFSVLLGQSLMSLFAALGAMATVLMLIFKDSIVGLVSGVQLLANDMLRPGDWIKIPQQDIDGMVTEVSLTTVKVRNWDNTITTVPPYTLVSDTFENWRVMQESGGRRVRRSLSVDMQLVRFCTPEEIERFSREDWFEPLKAADELTNLRVFRVYFEHYLRHHPRVNADLMLMLRHQQPTAQGLPIEIYFFSADRRWVPYETLQNEVFEHALAVLPRFGLRVFQLPSGLDLEQLGVKKD